MEGSGGEYSAEISKSSKSAKLGDEHRGWLNNGVGMDLIFSNSFRWVDVGFVGGGGFMGRMIVGIVKGFVGSFCVGAGIDTAVSLHASGSLSNPLSLLVMVLNAPLAVVPLLSEPKLFKLRPSLDERPGVGEVGGESQLMSRSGAVTEEVKGS